jgi:lipopolysaccharide export system protein LptA
LRGAIPPTGTSAVCALDASAQKNPGPPNALQGFSQNRDGKIRAASLELRERGKMGTFAGDVYELQGDAEMRCKVLVVSTRRKKIPAWPTHPPPRPGGGRQVRLSTCLWSRGIRNATGHAATFNMRENTVTLVGNVVVTRGGIGANVSVPTVKRLEAVDGLLGGRKETGIKLRRALEGAGIEFTNGDRPGCDCVRSAENASGRATDPYSQRRGLDPSLVRLAPRFLPTVSNHS